MNSHRQFLHDPPSWAPKIKPWLIRLLRRPRRWRTRWEQGIRRIDVYGLDRVRDAVNAGNGILITPNHPAHADPFVLVDIVDRVERPFYFMVAWQMLAGQGAIARAVLQRHGCFSVNREGTDWPAFQRAVEILCTSPSPLVMFPEGDIYHHNDHVAPFHEGCGIIAQTAARRAVRPIVCIPCALRYEYALDPTPALTRLADRLEESASRRRRPDLPLANRVRRLLAGLLRAKEQAHLGQRLRGTMEDRTWKLSETILSSLEDEYGCANGSPVLTVRVQALRQKVLDGCKRTHAHPEKLGNVDRVLADLSFVEQLFSYPPDYLDGSPSIERVAETLDKLEEDVLRLPTARVRGTRNVTVTFGDPVRVDPFKKPRRAAVELTQLLEAAVRRMLHPSNEPRAVRPRRERVSSVST